MPEISTGLPNVKTYRSGRVTTVVVTGPKNLVGVGVALRHPDDADDQQLGAEVAYSRALRDLADVLDTGLTEHFNRMTADKELRAAKKRQHKAREAAVIARKALAQVKAEADARGRAAEEGSAVSGSSTRRSKPGTPPSRRCSTAGSAGSAPAWPPRARPATRPTATS